MPNNEWGDFQTPKDLADQIIRTLPPLSWQRVLEPTCGSGNFLLATADHFPGVERIGIEVQETYASGARSTGATILLASIFDLHLGKGLPWRSNGVLLVVGNPPWVTNADLGAFGSINLPQKVNIRKLRGIEALTGASNFDIAEFMWLKLIIELVPSEPVIALLCKTQVARNVLSYCSQYGIAIHDASIRRIDAKRWFGASVDACLFTVTVGGATNYECPVYSSLEADAPEATIGFANGRLVADLDRLKAVAFADGACPLEWRQGVKHDAASVMELTVAHDGTLTNKRGVRVDVESEYVFPLLKATGLYRGISADDRRVIVTQRSLDDDTASLETQAPCLWRYLYQHAAELDARKSSIYRARGRFAMFGVGEYTFAPWKVAVSGLHKLPQFRVLGPLDGRPVLLDDTCYFLAFSSATEAALTAATLQAPAAQALLCSLAFTDSKRPITKRLLQRIDLAALIRNTPSADLIEGAQFDALNGQTPTTEDLERLLTVFEGGRLSFELPAATASWATQTPRAVPRRRTATSGCELSDGGHVLNRTRPMSLGPD